MIAGAARVAGALVFGDLLVDAIGHGRNFLHDLVNRIPDRFLDAGGLRMAAQKTRMFLLDPAADAGGYVEDLAAGVAETNLHTADGVGNRHIRGGFLLDELALGFAEQAKLDHRLLFRVARRVMASDLAEMFRVILNRGDEIDLAAAEADNKAGFRQAVRMCTLKSSAASSGLMMIWERGMSGEIL